MLYNTQKYYVTHQSCYIALFEIYITCYVTCYMIRMFDFVLSFTQSVLGQLNLLLHCHSLDKLSLWTK